MNLPIFGRAIDERFFDRRRRSTAIGGLSGAVVAGALFFYRLFGQHVISWDLFAVVATISLVKIGMMAWYYFTD
jgi:hypothetical protein